MGLFKKIGKALKKGVKAVGKVASKAAPLIAMVPGVGTLGGAALGAGGALLSGSNVGTALKRGALGAAGGIGGNLLRGRNLLTGAGKVAGLVGKGTTKAAGSMVNKGGVRNLSSVLAQTPVSPEADTPGLLSRVGRAAGSVGRGALNVAGDVAGTAGRWALDNPLLLAQGGLAALGTVQGAQQQGEADAMRRRALEGVMAEPEPGTYGDYTDPTNPYAMRGAGAMNPAQRSARRALSGY